MVGLVEQAPIPAAVLNDRLEYLAASPAWRAGAAVLAGDRPAAKPWVEQLRAQMKGLEILVLLVDADEGRDGSKWAEKAEWELGQISRELHDDITQRLAYLSIELGRCGATGMDPEAVRAARERLLELTEDVRRLSRRIYPTELKEFGLGVAVEGLCRDIAQSAGQAVKFGQKGRLAGLRRDLEVCLYRVAQEALQNAGRHAKAHQVTVQLRRKRRCVELEVADDGIGFAESNVEAGLGLNGMRERLEAAGGTISIDSTPGHGTRVTAAVPWLVS